MSTKNNKIKISKEAVNVLITVIASALSAFGLHIFVYPASFAPAGVDGIATMLQKATTWNAGYFSLMINIPLLIVAGDKDETVPIEENTFVFDRYYKSIGKSFTLIVKAGVGHHPHSLEDVAPIVEFIVK